MSRATPISAAWRTLSQAPLPQAQAPQPIPSQRQTSGQSYYEETLVGTNNSGYTLLPLSGGGGGGGDGSTLLQTYAGGSVGSASSTPVPQIPSMNALHDQYDLDHGPSSGPNPIAGAGVGAGSGAGVGTPVAQAPDLSQMQLSKFLSEHQQYLMNHLNGAKQESLILGDRMNTTVKYYWVAFAILLLLIIGFIVMIVLGCTQHSQIKAIMNKITMSKLTWDDMMPLLQ
jgi:hypothetical protein